MLWDLRRFWKLIVRRLLVRSLHAWAQEQTCRGATRLLQSSIQTSYIYLIANRERGFEIRTRYSHSLYRCRCARQQHRTDFIRLPPEKYRLEAACEMPQGNACCQAIDQRWGDWYYVRKIG